MKYSEICGEIQRITNGERYDFFAERVDRGYLGVNDAKVYFGGHVFRGVGFKHCLIVEVPTLHSNIRGCSHHFVWYYVKHEEVK